MKLKFITLFTAMLSGVAFSQDFASIDSYAGNVKYNGDLKQLTTDVTAKSNTPIEKTRAIYDWIVENISYDIKEFNTNKNGHKVAIDCKTPAECDLKKIQIENDYIEQVLKKKRGVCSGYAKLFKRMCQLADITCYEINGYTKDKPNQVGRMGTLNHAWNSVIIDKKIYYFDLTWAAGQCDTDANGALKEFVKKRNDFYWMIPLEKLSIDHYPEKPNDLVGFNISKEEYRDHVFIEKSILPITEVMKPESGIIKAKLGDTINFKVKYSGKLDKLQINTNIKRNQRMFDADGATIERAAAKQEYIPFVKEEEIYYFDYIISDERIKSIEVLFDYNLKLKFNVETGK